MSLMNDGGASGQFECNYAGSSLAMEMIAAGDLFQRSEKRLYLRYTKIITDGDTRTVGNLNAVV